MNFEETNLHEDKLQKYKSWLKKMIKVSDLRSGIKNNISVFKIISTFFFVAKYWHQLRGFPLVVK